MKPSAEPPFEEGREQGISLRSLTEAFAQALGRVGPEADAREAEPVAQAERPAPDEAWEEPPAEVQADETCPIGPMTILEAMLFVDNSENRPLAASRAAELMRGVEPSEIHELVRRLNERYRANRCPYQVVSEDAGYRMQLRSEFHGLRNRFHGRVREARLSQAAIDVLAIVAYRQPLSGDEVTRLRDKPSGHLLAQLVRRRLLRIERPADRSQKAVYHTTDRFLDLFGLASLDDLPQSEELDRR
ncbi:MAG: SMC-Scp complex subunit ScpB [Pirellulales bacterium]|nr:SMC-Scp complex subunit ScpB [Pirellulales bacterium]